MSKNFLLNHDFIIFLQIIQDPIIIVLKYMVLKNTRSSNCNILVKVVKQLRHVSLKTISGRSIIGYKCCCTHIFFLKKIS